MVKSARVAASNPSAVKPRRRAARSTPPDYECVRPEKACSLGLIFGAVLGSVDDFGREALGDVVLVGQPIQPVGDRRDVQPLGDRGSHDLVPPPDPALGLVEHLEDVAVDAEVGEVDRRHTPVGEPVELGDEEVRIDVGRGNGRPHQV
jgi:hypothetical protein